MMISHIQQTRVLLAASLAAALVCGPAEGQAVQAEIGTGQLGAGVGVEGQPSPSMQTISLVGLEGSFFEQATASAGGANAIATIDTDVTFVNGSISRYVLTGSHSTSSLVGEFDPGSFLNLILSFSIDRQVEVSAFGFVEAGPVDRVTTSMNMFGFNAVVGGANPRETYDATGIANPGPFTYDFNLNVVSGPSVFHDTTAPGDVTYSFTFEFDPLAATQTWDNPAGGLYSAGSNWASDNAPASGDNIVFNLPGSGYVVEMDEDPTVGSATVEKGTVSWRFNGNAGNTLNINDQLTVGTEPGVRAGLDVIGGTVNVGDVNIGTADNADALVTLREGAVLNPIGDVNVGGGADAMSQLFIISGSTLQLDEGESLNVTGTNAQVTADALSIGTTDLGGGVINVLQGAGLTVNGDLDILRSDLTISDDSQVTFGGSAQFTPGSRVRVTDGGRLEPVSFDDAGGAVLINTSGLTDEDAGVEIAGENSRLRVGAQDIAIGTANNAEVEVSAGGELTTLGNMVLGSMTAGSFGEVIVTGAGSNVLAENIMVYSSGDVTSVFEVADGGSASVFSVFEASDSEVTIYGAGSEMNIQNQFRITGGATAAVHIDSGGRLLVNTDLDNLSDDPFSLVFDSIDPSVLTSADLVAGGTTVSGAGSEVRTLGNVFIGSQSDGLLTVADSGLFLTLGGVYLGDAAIDTKGFLVVDDTSQFLADFIVVGEDGGGEGQFLARNNAVPQVLTTLDVRGTGTVSVNPQSSILVGSFDDVQAARRDNYVVIGTDGLLTGSGEVQALTDEAGGVNNLSGTVTPGSSPGTLTIQGDYLQGEAGTLIIEIAGTDADTEYDVLAVTGDAAIQGTVVFQFIDGFAPTAGEVYNFLDVDGETQLTNVDIQIQGLLPGFEYDIEPQAPGGPYALTALSHGQAIPEPGSLALLSLAGLLTARRRRG